MPATMRGSLGRLKSATLSFNVSTANLLKALIRRTTISGAVGAATSTVALALAAKGGNEGAVQPLNATSHWLNGDRAARRSQIDVRHTGVGLATHLAATAFWAAFFEAWLSARPARSIADVGRRAAAVSALAAVVDYTITPKRFTPGW